MRFRLAAAALLILATPVLSAAPRTRAYGQDSEGKKMQYIELLLNDYCSGTCKNKDCCSVVAF
ncbi:MAG TPA: hypothetical protein VM890_14045 [Longimicrobium sp.]|jgi:hypothetical protein|nr:hypothetical protein [Longimicrobium sp.]